MESARSVRDIDPFSSKASMMAVRDVEIPLLAGRRPFFSAARSEEGLLLSAANAGFILRMVDPL